MQRSTAIALTILTLALTPSAAMAAGYFKSLSVPPVPQEKNYYCSAAVVQMWVGWLDGSAPSQDKIAEEQGITPSGGLNAREMADALEDYSANWFNVESHSDSKEFAQLMMEEIQSDEPVAVVAYTRYANGTQKPNQHWMLVDSFWQSSTHYSPSYANLKGFYMNDPLHNAPWDTSPYEVTAPDEFVTKDYFFTSVASKYDDKHYLVRD